MMQLVQDWYVPREVNPDESLTETLMEWFSRRPSLRDVTVTSQTAWRPCAVRCRQTGTGHWPLSWLGTQEPTTSRTTSS
jgi:hypothetical protein